MGKPRNPVSQAKTRDRAGDLGRAFDKLRDSLPTYQSGRKKLTKIETLKLAVIYIDDLANLLVEVERNPSNLDSPDVRLPRRKRRSSSSTTASSPGRSESACADSDCGSPSSSSCVGSQSPVQPEAVSRSISVRPRDNTEKRPALHHVLWLFMNRFRCCGVHDHENEDRVCFDEQRK